MWRRHHDAMNNITLEEEEESVLSIDVEETIENTNGFTGFNAKLCGGQILNGRLRRFPSNIADSSGLVKTWEMSIHKGSRS